MKTMEDLFKDSEFLLSTNLELTLYKLVESCGIKKEDVLEGKYDKQLSECKDKIYSLFLKASTN